MNCFMGIDLGTSAVKTILIDENGRGRGLREQRYPIHHPSPGFAEQSPEEWWTATVTCLRALLAAPEARGCSVHAVGLSGQMHGLVSLDDGGAPLRNAIIWPDTRTAGICSEWTKTGLAELFNPVTGLPLATGFFAPSLEWVRREEPIIFSRTAKVIPPKDYIRFRLTGAIATDPSDASGTYLFDIRERRWSSLVMKALGFDARILPGLEETISVAGSVTTAVAAQTGLPAGVPVATGGSDQAMAALALGLERPGQVAAAISTGATIITPVDSPVVDRRLHTLCHAFEGKWLLMGAALSAGSAVSWFTERIIAAGAQPEAAERGPTIEHLIALAETVPAGANGLFFLPYLSGDRTPHMNPNAQGSFVGLTLYHSAAHMMRAILEGVAYSLYDSVEIFRELGAQVSETLCYAGGSRSATWRQIIADVFNCPVQWRRFSDYSALGAAICGARAVGVEVPQAAPAESAGDLRTPRAREVETYCARRATFARLYERLEPLFEEISGQRQ